MSAQEPKDTNQELNAEHVMESLGEPKEAAHDIDDAGTYEGTSNNTNEKSDPLYVQKRLKQQSRQHDREMREMQAQMAAIHAQMNQGGSQPAPIPNSTNGAMNGADPIQQAVHYALQQRDLQEQQKRNAESQAYVESKRAAFRNHLDSMEDKYEDFREKVFNRDLPITSTMSEYAMTLPPKGAGAGGEVLYHLANHPEELKRISKLPPIDQASEMAKLSHALISGGIPESAQTHSSKVAMGNIKSMPIPNSGGVTDKTSPSDIRALMKAGKWK